jgi:hypothetical protein
MLSEFLKKNITSQASYVSYGYGQVEPNHLSAQRTSQVYAQLPAAADIKVLEQGQFVKYDYAKGVVNFEGKGEWMLVYNEIKLYRDHQMDCEFAMVKDNYQARVYSPFGYGVDKDGKPTADLDTAWDRQSRYYNGEGVSTNGINFADGKVTVDGKEFPIDDVTAAPDMYEIHYNEDPFHIEGPYKEARMPEGTTMVPRVFKTNVGDIFTTNTINATPEQLTLGATLKVGADGILEPGEDDKMTWQVVKVYTMPDHQPGVKIMRIV